MDDQLKQCQQQLDNLRKLVKEKDSQIHDLETQVEEQEQSLHEAQRKVTATESKLVRIQTANADLQSELDKVKAGQKASFAKMQQLHKASSEGVAQGQDSRATPQKGASFATMAGVNPVHSSQPVPSTPSVASGVDTLWAQSAKLVLGSYDVRVRVLMEESHHRSTLLALHQAVLLETGQALRERAETLSRTSMTVTKLAQCDEERRFEQFRELTALREGMLMLEREKAVLSREVTTMDTTVSELEEQVGRGNRERLEFIATHEELLIKYSALVKRAGETTVTQDRDMTRDNILQHSELRADNVRLQDELVCSRKECSILKQKIVNMRNEFAENKKHMNLIIDDSIASREAIMSEMREDKLLVSGMTTGGGNFVGGSPRARAPPGSPLRRSGTGRGDTADTLAKLQRRVIDLEKTVEVKDAQVQNLSSQQRRKKQQQLYVDASVSMKDPYSKGLVRSRTPTTQQRNKELLSKSIGMSDPSADWGSNANKVLSQSALSHGAGLGKDPESRSFAIAKQKPFHV